MFAGNYPPAPAPGYITPNAPGYEAPPAGYGPPAAGQYPPPSQYPPGTGQYPPGAGHYPPGPGQYPPGPAQYPPGHGPIVNQPTGPGGPQPGIIFYLVTIISYQEFYNIMNQRFGSFC